VCEHRVGIAFLDDTPVPQHYNAMRERTHDFQVVADKEIGQSMNLLQPPQEITDVDIQRAGFGVI